MDVAVYLWGFCSLGRMCAWLIIEVEILRPTFFYTLKAGLFWRPAFLSIKTRMIFPKIIDCGFAAS